MTIEGDVPAQISPTAAIVVVSEPSLLIREVIPTMSFHPTNVTQERSLVIESEHYSDAIKDLASAIVTTSVLTPAAAHGFLTHICHELADDEV
jgi:hypothetical protein